MGKSLIIVESPAKTKTLKGFLGRDFQVEASMGHVRDLPASKLGVDVDNNFEPSYVPIPDRKDVLKNWARRPGARTPCTWRAIRIAKAKRSRGTSPTR
jgi:DNA topoisomerase-1